MLYKNIPSNFVKFTAASFVVTFFTFFANNLHTSVEN